MRRLTRSLRALFRSFDSHADEALRVANSGQR